MVSLEILVSMRWMIHLVWIDTTLDCPAHSVSRASISMVKRKVKTKQKKSNCWSNGMSDEPLIRISMSNDYRSPVNSPHKGQWRGVLMLSLICAWTNGWANHIETPSRSLCRNCSVLPQKMVCFLQCSLHLQSLRFSSASIAVNLEISINIHRPPKVWHHFG